jgi:hypothetical protein
VVWPERAVDEREGEKQNEQRSRPTVKKPQAYKKTEKQRFAQSTSEKRQIRMKQLERLDPRA